jgi:hypothetical protein
MKNKMMFHILPFETKIPAVIWSTERKEVKLQAGSCQARSVTAEPVTRC